MTTLRYACVLLLSLFGLSVSAGQRVYVAGGDQVTVFSLDEETGKLTALEPLELPGAGPMRATPDRKRIYLTARGSQGPAIATLDVKPDGTLKKAYAADINYWPSYIGLDRTNTYLAGNHYREGKASVWKLGEDGVFRGNTVIEIDLEKCAHAAVFSPNNRFLLVPATGPNKVFQLRFNEKTGRVTPNDPPYAEGPIDNAARQPRHLVFHPKLPVAYTTNERQKPGVGMWSWDATAGTLKTVQNLVSVPEGFKGTITTADIHITPDGRYLYISNRDLTVRDAKTGESSIAAFSLDPETGRMTKIGTFPCEHVPRSICLDETGRYLIVAGQMEDMLGVYRIDPASGKLTRTDRKPVPTRPSWVLCLQVAG